MQRGPTEEEIGLGPTKLFVILQSLQNTLLSVISALFIIRNSNAIQTCAAGCALRYVAEPEA